MTKNNGNYVFLPPRLPMAGPYVPVHPPMPMAGAYAPVNPPLPMAGMGQVEAWQPNVLGVDVTPPATGGIIDSIVTMLSDIPWWGWVGGGIACYWLAKKSGILKNPDDYYTKEDTLLTEEEKAGKAEVDAVQAEIASKTGVEVQTIIASTDEQKQQQIAASIAVTAGLPIIIWGPPGIGKTEWAYALAKRLNAHMEVVLGSTKDPTDIAGIPNARDATVIPPTWAKNLRKAVLSGKKTILFLDEFSAATEIVHSALLRVIREHVVGDLDLDADPNDPKKSVPHNLKVRVIAAANQKKYSAGGRELPAPAANRIIHLFWDVPNPRTWAMGMLTGDWGEKQVYIVPDDWKKGREYISAKEDIATFLQLYPIHRHNMPRERVKQGVAWPSPRSWDIAAEALGAVRAMRRTEKIDERVENILIVGAVGDEAGGAFNKWLRGKEAAVARRKATGKFSDIEHVIKDPSKWGIPADQEHAEITREILISMTNAIMHKPTLERWHKGWEVLKTIYDRADKKLGDSSLVDFVRSALHYSADILDEMVDDERFPQIIGEKIPEPPVGYEEILVTSGRRVSP